MRIEPNEKVAHFVNYLLTIHLLHKDLFIWVEEKQIAPVKELVDQIKQAIASPQS